MQYRYLLACLLLALVSIEGHGQDNRVMSLPQLWEQAFNNYPSLAAYQARLQQATLDQKLARNQKLPQLNLQVQNTIGTQNTIGGAFFPLPGSYNVAGSGIGNTAGPSANLLGSLIMDWEFLQFGRQKKTMEAAAIMTRHAGYRLEAAQVTIQAELSRTYFALLFHRQMERWAQQNTERLQQLFEASQSTARAGLSPGADSLLVKASLRQTAAKQDDWEGQSQESAIALATWINLPASQLSLKNSSFPAASKGAIPIMEPDAEAQHPQLAFRQQGIAYAGKQKEIAGANVLPTLSLLGGVQLRNHAPTQEGTLGEGWGNVYSNPTHNYLLGLGLRWNLTELFDYKLVRARHQEEIHLLQAEADETVLNLQSRRHIAQRQMTQGLSQIENAEEAYEAASEAYHLFETRYKSGLISISELLQIQDILQNTEKTRIEAYYRYWQQQADFAEASADFSILQTAFE